MLDVVLRNATVVDGTGARRRRADVGIRDGRIVAVGTVDRAGGHRDSTPTGWWSPRASSTPTPTTTPSCSGTRSASPSNLHGVTTVIGGQLRLHPGAARGRGRRLHPPDDGQGRGHAAGRPGAGRAVDLVDASASTSTGSKGRLGVNAGFLVGHCALRRKVMGADAAPRWRPATRRSRPCAACSAESLAAGGLGLLLLPVAHPLRRRRPTRSARATPTAGRCWPSARRCAAHDGHHARVHHERLPRRLQRRRDRPDGGHDGHRPAGPSTGTC